MVGQIQCFRRMAGTSMAGLAAVGCVAVVFLAEPVAAGSEAVEAPSGCFGISSITPTSSRVRYVRSRIMADGSDETDSFLVNPTERSTTPRARAFPPGFLTASDFRDQNYRPHDPPPRQALPDGKCGHAVFCTRY